MAVSHPSPWPCDRHSKPKRRVPVGGKDNQNLYWRRDGRIEIGYRDSAGKQRWTPAFDTITQTRRERDKILGARAKGERVQPNPKLKFGEAASRWIAEQVCELRRSTQANYRNSIEVHLRPRWGNRRMDHIDVNEAAKLVRELRAEGKAESTIATVLRAASRVFKFARRRCGWHGDNPFALLENGERPRVSEARERRVYTPDELAQVLAATHEPWRTLFKLASVVGGRESELLGLWWEDLDLADVGDASIRFGHQVDRKGQRVELKTAESKATLPLPRSAAVMLLEHKARSEHTGPRSFVFSTTTGRAVSQRNTLRALYKAQAKARKADGTPTFPELFEHDEHGHLVVNENGKYVLRKVKRRELNLPDFHALRHGAAMDCDDAEEARDLLRHKNSNVTRAVYRSHFSDKRRELLRAKLEARHAVLDVEAQLEAPDRTGTSQTATPELAEVVQLRG
jgi:integrase